MSDVRRSGRKRNQQEFESGQAVFNVPRIDSPLITTNGLTVPGIQTGAWTPVIGGTSGPAWTTSVADGSYYQIGQLTFVRALIIWTAIDGGTGGSVQITGNTFIPTAAAYAITYTDGAATATNVRASVQNDGAIALVNPDISTVPVTEFTASGTGICTFSIVFIAQ